VNSTIISKTSQEQISPQHSELDVVAPSTQTAYRCESKLEVALILIGALVSEILSPETLHLAFSQAKARRPNYIDEDTYLGFLEEIYTVADRIRRSNPLSGMF